MKAAYHANMSHQGNTTMVLPRHHFWQSLSTILFALMRERGRSHLIHPTGNGTKLSTNSQLRTHNTHSAFMHTAHTQHTHLSQLSQHTHLSQLTTQSQSHITHTPLTARTHTHTTHSNRLPK
jgi:hypothetical protein